MADSTRRPKIVAITNEGPDWSDLDKQYGDEMWHMLLNSSSDLELTFDGITSDHNEGSCQWTALYTFTKTNRKVTNHIHANFRFENGKIVSHKDAFDFWRWSRQAFGFTGFLLGWTPYFRNKVRSTAKLRLKNFIEKHSEYRSL